MLPDGQVIRPLSCEVLKEAIETCPDDLCANALYKNQRYCALGWLYHVAGWSPDPMTKNGIAGTPAHVEGIILSSVILDGHFPRPITAIPKDNDRARLKKKRKELAILHYRELAAILGCEELANG